MLTEANPWKTLSSKVVYQNPWIKVREDRVITPSGGDGIYGVVQVAYATGVVALTPQNEVYLVGQYRYPMEEYSWEIVEGGAKEGETPLKAVTRELREEAGLVAQHVEQLGAEVHLSNCFTNERAFLFLARDFNQVSTEPDGTEQLQVRKVPFAECLRMVRSGEMKDAMTIIAMERAAVLLGER
jgi:8-oxo-dGTP pyrophosphatase MutT (NUDIX family)